MQSEKTKRSWKGLLGFFAVIGVVITLFMSISSGMFATAAELGNIITGENTSTKATQDGCAIKIETTEKVSWQLPRQPIDLVIIQDASGSFEETMPNIKEALKRVTETTTEEAYDEKNPKLVFTDNPDTTDRVMVTSYAGIDASRQYDNVNVTSRPSRFVLDPASDWVRVAVNTTAIGDSYSYTDQYGRYITDFYQPGQAIYDYYGRFVRTAGSREMNINGMYAKGYHEYNDITVTGTDSNFETLVREDQLTSARYRFDTNGQLLSSTAEIDAEVNKITTGGGTPTVPAIEDAIKQYEDVKGDMKNGRKTVFLLITDGIANGYRENGTVYIDRSLYRTYNLMRDWGTNGRMPEAAQNYLARAEELVEAGDKLKAAAGDTGKVVVGFWEDKKTLQQFDTGYGYLYAYDNAFGTPGSRTNIQTGDDRSIREVFTTALQSVASEPDVLPTGEAANYYVEDTDIDQFAAKILKSITAAITKEDVSGNFTVTEGYTVESVTINGKQVVSEVTDEENQVRGTVKQDGQNVTITVPESVFNPGNNDFNYELKRTEEAESLDEADEVEPPENYVPEKTEREVGQLVGTFKVGDYESAQIGSSTPTKVEVTDLKYCYPRATKDVKDQDATNDTNGDDGKSGIIAEDPLLKAAGISRQTYAATLSDQSELFTYSIRYNMYNAPLEMDRNVMLVDTLDYRINYQDAYVTDDMGNKLSDFKISTKEITDSNGNPTTIVYATVPKLPGEQSETVNEGEYGGHKFKVYNLVVTAKIKDEYTFENNENVYKSMMTDNGGLGFLNQAQIVWNGSTADPQDKDAELRRSNAVYVVPPVKTDITKKVSQSQTADGTDHLELPTRLDDYYYQISSTWPGLFDSYVIEDILVPELMSLHDVDNDDKVFVNGQEAPTLTQYLKKETVEVNGEQRDRVYFELNSANLSRLQLRRINAEIEKLNEGNDGPATITLGIKARIRDNAVLAKYADANGKIQVPNTANVILNNESQTSNKVTVSPNSPAAIKLINEEKTELFTTVNEDGEGEAFNYDVQATLPNDINDATEYYIKDILDDRLELVPSGNAADADNDGVYMVGTDAEHFTTEVKTEDGKQVVYARLKESAFDQVKANDVIHLVIHARIKAGATGSIENTATVNYNGKPTPPTPPVVVTPPPTVTKTVEPTVESREANLENDQVPAGTYTAKINKEGEDIELAVWNDPYVYKVNSVVPKGATTFTIKDVLIPEMEILDAVSDKNPRKVEIDVDGTKESLPADQIKVDKSDVNKQTISVTLTEDQIAKYADKAITLTFTAKFKTGASLTQYISKENGLPKAPNTATIKVNDNPEIESNTVTVTPPINKPEIKKTVNNKSHADLDGRYELFAYKIETSVPYNANEFVITDTLEPVLHFASDLSRVTFKIGDKTYTGDELAEIIKLEEKEIDGQKRSVLTATLQEKHIKGNEAKPVVVEFLAQVNDEADLSKYRYVTENHSERYGTDADHAEIPNEASYVINNNVKEVSNKVTVTPPAPTPSKLDKKIEDVYSKEDPKPLVEHLDVENGKDYNYVIDATLPSNIFEYKSWMLEDTLDPRLELSDQDEPVIIAVHPDGAPASAEDEAYIKDHFNITIEDAEVDGKATKKVVVKVPEDKMKELHDKYQIRLYIPARIKDGVTDTNIPNDAIKTGIKPNGETHVVKTPPVTVTPPQEVPTPKKTVDNQEELSLATLEQEFTYRVAVTVPENIAGMSKFELSDDLEDILTVTDTAVTIDGQEDEKVSVTSTKDANDANGKVVAALPVDEIASYKGKEMILTIKARIKDGVSASELAKYVTATNQDGSIPNKATLTVGDKPEQKKDSNEVPVTPPGEDPNVSKKINETEDSAIVLPETDYTYNIKSTLPVDITSYKKFVIVDNLDENLAIQGTPVITGDAAKFFNVAVDGQTVTATMKDIKDAKDLAGQTVELVITAQVKATSTAAKIDNKATVQYQNKSHVDGEPDTTVDTPPVTVTPPPLTKKINETLDHLDTATKTDYTYNIKTTLPSNIGDYKTFVINDDLDKDLEVQGTPVMTGAAADFFKVTVDGQKVRATITDFEAAKAMAGKEVELVITSQIREGVTRQAIPNEATITYTNKAKADGTPGDTSTTPPTPPVTVTPPGENPTVDKKINGSDTEAVILPETNFTYNVKSTLPVDITSYKKFVIVDNLDENLAIQGTPVITGDAAKFFDVAVDGQTVTATMKDIKDAKDLAGQTVELVITAQVKATSTAAKIDNKATVQYQNKSHVDGEPDTTVDTPPVTVTPPPLTKKINETLDHLDTATKTDYTYNIKTTLPSNIGDYKTFVINDDLDKDLEVQGTPVMTGAAADFFKVTVDGQKVRATITDFEAAKAMAGKEVELVITSQIREGVTRQAIPNEATITYTNKAKADGTPGDTSTTPPTPPVTVTPPGENPTVDKKINGSDTEAVILPETNFTYNVKSTLPVDITSYKKFVIVDNLDENLAIQGTPVITGDAAKFFDVAVDGQTVTATMKDIKDAKDLAGQTVELVITAQVKATSTAAKIDNKATVQYQNKSHVDGEPDTTVDTPPVTVTPPPLTKKINETLDHLDTATKTDYTYNIKTTLPSNIGDYKTFVINDDLDKDLEVQGTPVMTGAAADFFKVTVDGQKVRATITDFEAAKAMAGKEVELVITSQIREGVTRQAIPNEATITYTNKAKADGTPGDTSTTPPTPPVTVTPPGENPTVDKKINGSDTEAVILPETNFTYNVKSTLPVDITSYKKFVIVDNLDENLAIQGTPVITGDAAKFFDVAVDGQTVTATMKDIKDAKDLAGQTVELVITAQVKATSTAAKIDNKATVQYQNKSHVDGEPDTTVDTPPVTVTPPPLTKKINETLDHLDTATKTDYTYNIKTTLPSNIGDYKTFVINDDLDKDLEVQGTPVMTGAAADFFKVTVDGQKVRATITDFEAAKAMAGKEVELVITSQIRDGVTRQAIPNEATITYTNKAKADGTPGDTSTTPPTPPVTVTPPGENPTVDKKINGSDTEAVILPETNFTYNVKSTLPVDITSYKKFVIVDNLDENLAIQGTPVITGDAAKFFDVAVDGQTVTATMKDIKDAKDLAGQTVELVITAQVKATSTAAKIDNKATVQYQNKSHVDGEPDTTVDTPPVTVTPPPLTKKINETLDHLDTATKTDYTYNIKTTLPSNIGDYKTFVINDDLDKDLEVQGTPVMTGAAADFFKVTVDGQKVRATITDFEAAKAMAGKEVELVITSQIRDGVTRQAIPNEATITYTNKAKADGTPGDTSTTPPTPPVTVTPPGENPTVDKKINGSDTEAVILPETNFTYNVKSTLPVDITSYKKFVIVDNLDENLAIQGTPVITGDAAKFFDVAVDGQTVTATMKDIKDAKDLAGQTVELVITAQVKATSTAAKIDNKATVQYQNKSHVDGEPDTTVDTPPVTVTPPPLTKKINETLDHLDTATKTDYTYNIKTTLPSNIGDYKTFVINDDLDKDLEVQGTPVMTGAAADFFKVTVDGQKVRATITDFEAAKAMAGKEVELVITSQIRDGVTRQAIPNEATITYTNKAKADGTPGDTSTTPPTPPVTVTPPGENPTVEKKINKELTELDIDTEKDYDYNITTTLPVDITSYKKFVIVDELDKDLEVQGTPTITGDAAKFFDVAVDGQTVTATMKDFKDAKALAGKPVELVITSQIREGVTRQGIPNTTKVTYQNKSHVDGKPDSETPPTPPVTVTPPTPNTPPIEKKVNGADSANLEARQEVFTYMIDTAVPTGAHAFEITDTLEDVLTFEGDVTATLDDKAISADQIKIDGQTVTVKLTKEQVRKQAGKAVHVEFSAKVKDGANLTPYMTDGKTSIPNTASYIINNNPDTKKDSNTVPVVPPTPNEPGIDKKINRDLTHLDIEENKSYMYNVNVDLPQDIATYKEFIVTDNLVDALAINGDVVAYVDGYSTDAIKVDVAGNKVTATVTDFAKLAGFKEIQLYIPAIIADATKASEYVDNKVPNTARLDFVDSNGVKKNKETNPVTVTPPTPPTPPNTPKEPTPDAPRKTVSLVDGLEQAEYLRLPEASQAFRFDIKSVVPKDQAEDNRLDLSSITITDTLDPLFTVKKENVFVKITGNAPAEANFIDEDVAKAVADLKDAEDKLKELKASSNKETALTELEVAKKTVADLEAKLEADNKVLAELKAASTTETSDATAETETSSEEVTDNSAAIAEQEKVIANDKAQLETAKTALATAETAVAEAKTVAEIQVDISNQEKVIAEAKTVKEKAEKRQEKLQARLTSLAKLTAKGELTNEAIAELGGNISITDNGRTVMVDFSDEYTMEALKGYTVNVIIYSSITDVTALKDVHFTKGIDNTATVQFNHDPSVNLTKKTNKVTVVPPRKNTPPKGQTPPPPKGELPRIPERKPKPKHIPPANTPKAKKKLPSTLPKTGESSSHLGLIGLGIVSLGSLAFYMVSRKKRDF